MTQSSASISVPKNSIVQTVFVSLNAFSYVLFIPNVVEQDGKVIRVDANYKYSVRPISTCRAEEEAIVSSTEPSEASKFIPNQQALCSFGEKELSTFDVRCCDDCGVRYVTSEHPLHVPSVAYQKLLQYLWISPIISLKCWRGAAYVK